MKINATWRAGILAGLAAAILAVVSACATTGAADAEASVAAMVRERLAQDTLTRQNTFSVSGAGGVVTVRGLVRTEAERARILGIARGTPGVTAVVDRLQRY